MRGEGDHHLYDEDYSDGSGNVQPYRPQQHQPQHHRLQLEDKKQSRCEGNVEKLQCIDCKGHMELKGP